MPTTVNLRRILDKPSWEMCATPSNSYGFYHAARSTLWDQLQMWVGDYTGLYSPLTDSWLIMNPASPLVNTSTACFHPNGPTGTATAGTASTLTTNLTLPGSLANYSIRLTGGTGGGQERVISGNTYGANAVITVSTPWTITPDGTTTYVLITGRFWVFGASLRYFEVATNTWSGALSISGAAVGTITCTPSFGNVQATGTATSATATTLVNSGKNWATNQFRNSQVRILSGTGAGQLRIITASDATSLTVATWTVTPDNTSVYNIEPDDNALYAMNGTTLYKYSISGNTWSTITPGVARTSALSGPFNFVGTAYDPTWADETNIKNSRYIYSFGAANLAIYDIALNTWNNVQTAYQRYNGNQFYPTSWALDREIFYLIQQPAVSAVTAGGIITGYNNWKFNCATQTLDSWGWWNIPTGVGGSLHCSLATYNDGATTITYVYQVSGGYYDYRLWRQLVIP